MNYIIYGEVYPLIKTTVNKILKECVGQPDDFNVVKLDYEECNIFEIVDEGLSLPLGYDKKAVVVDNCSFLEKDGKAEDKKVISDLLKKSTNEISLIFILRNEKLDPKNEILSLLDSKKNILKCNKIKPDEWFAFARNYFEKRNVKISNDALKQFIIRIDDDLNRFYNEAEKLCLYKNEINLSDVLLMVSKPLEDDAFKISNALLKNDNSLAISIYRDLKLLGIKFVDALIPMLASQFRFISQVSFLARNGLGSDEIAKQLGATPMRVEITLKNSRNITRRQIAHALDDLYNLDLQIKSGQIDRSYGLELFLINFPN